MIINTDFNKCILCLENDAILLEHIIPKSIGGRLQAKMLCKKCNNDFGSKLISKVKSSPSIRLCITNLKKEIPKLFENMEEGQTYFAGGVDKIKLVRKNLKTKVIPQKNANGSLIYDVDEADIHIRKMLEKEGVDTNDIENKLQLIKNTENNNVINLINNIRVTKESMSRTGQDLNTPSIDKKVPALMAYEFLSLFLGGLIYDKGFNFLRSFIQNDNACERIILEEFLQRNYESCHCIYPEFLETESIVTIILFGSLIYKVHLKRINIKSQDYVYLENLRTKKSLIAKSLKEARKHIYFEVTSNAK